jgi:hypothetical protein
MRGGSRLSVDGGARQDRDEPLEEGKLLQGQMSRPFDAAADSTRRAGRSF